MDMICRKTMTRCPTPGTCAPHNGCRDDAAANGKELQNLRADNSQLNYALKQSEQRYLELQAELEKVKADRKACWEEFKAQGRQLDQFKAENERLRKLPTCWSEVLEQSEANDELLDKVLELSRDAERWRFVRNPIGNGSPFAIWSERTNLFLGKFADEAIDDAMSKGVANGQAT